MCSFFFLCALESLISNKDINNTFFFSLFFVQHWKQKKPTPINLIKFALSSMTCRISRKEHTAQYSSWDYYYYYSNYATMFYNNQSPVGRFTGEEALRMIESQTHFQTHHPLPPTPRWTIWNACRAFEMGLLNTHNLCSLRTGDFRWFAAPLHTTKNHQPIPKTHRGHDDDDGQSPSPGVNLFLVQNIVGTAHSLHVCRYGNTSAEFDFKLHLMNHSSWSAFVSCVSLWIMFVATFRSIIDVSSPWLCGQNNARNFNQYPAHAACHFQNPNAQLCWKHFHKFVRKHNYHIIIHP